MMMTFPSWMDQGTGVSLDSAIAYCVQMMIHSPAMARAFDTLEDQ